MKVIGVTGGVGSGKSRVLDYLKECFSAHIIQADEVGHRLMEPQGATYCALLKHYGQKILSSDGTISKEALANIGFSNPEAVKQLNELTHPIILEEIQREITEIAEKGNYPYLFYEAAIPREAEMERLCEEIWYIHVSKEVRIERLMESRGYSREKCEEVIKLQMDEAEFEKIADQVIENGGAFEETADQIDGLLSKK